MSDSTPTTLPLSILRSFEEKERLEREAKKILEDLAEKLMRLIPPSLERWAEEKGFIRQEMETYVSWNLPGFLEFLVRNTRMRSCCSDEYTREDPLDAYGFTSLADARRKFMELKRAWDGIITIKIGEYAGEISIVYIATEMRPRKSRSKRKTSKT